jgi:hypothetical protein
LKRICTFAVEYLKNNTIAPEQWQKLINVAAKEIDENEAHQILAGMLTTGFYSLYLIS